MADDDSRNEDAPERSGKPSDKKDDAKAKPKAKGSKSKKSDEDTSAKTKTDDKKSDKKDAKKKEPKNPDARRGFFGRIFLFFREVVEQLRKVVYPTRKELLTYTLVVIVFVTFMLAVIFGFDQGYTVLVELVFGNTVA